MMILLLESGTDVMADNRRGALLVLDGSCA
jgi:hypothetical protein